MGYPGPLYLFFCLQDFFQVDSLRGAGLMLGSGRSPGGRHRNPLQCSGESHGQRSLVGYSPWGRQELDMTKATSVACRRCTLEVTCRQRRRCSFTHTLHANFLFVKLPCDLSQSLHLCSKGSEHYQQFSVFWYQCSLAFGICCM